MDETERRRDGETKGDEEVRTERGEKRTGKKEGST
jgi:hypothetical protein